MTRARSAIIITAILVVAASATAGATTYELRVLDYYRDLYSACATDINSDGRVVGYCGSDASSQYVAPCWWDGTTAHVLGTTNRLSDSVAVNASGDVVAGKYVWRDGVRSELPLLMSGTNCNNNLCAISDSGIVVGCSGADTITLRKRACYWNESGVHDLAVLSGHMKSEARGINGSGEIVGFSLTDAGVSHAVKWNASGQIQCLGYLAGCTGSTALSINDGGDVVGYSHHPYDDRATLWRGGQMIDLSIRNRPSYAMDINNVGQIVGYSSWSDDGYLGCRALIWENGVATELPALGGDSRALGINDNGWIVGQAIGSDQRWHAVVWVPVPEPCGIVALLACLGMPAAASIRRRRKPAVS